MNDGRAPTSAAVVALVAEGFSSRLGFGLISLALPLCRNLPIGSGVTRIREAAGCTLMRLD